MSSAENSFVGFAKQAAKGTPNTTDASFKYMLFTEGNIAPNNIVAPLPPEVGGGALQRNLLKMGVNAAGAQSFIPRPETLGFLLNGLLGTVDTTDNEDGSYQHDFTLGSDPFAAPYYTVRSAPGNLWGEQHEDVRISLLNLSWQGADFVRGAVGFIGAKSKRIADMSGWGALAKVDGGPQLLSPLGTIELPTGTNAKVLRGSLTMAAQIPLDEQYIVGSYYPDGLDIVAKNFAFNFDMKVDSATLYSKMAYDPAGGNDWVADMLREADINFTFASNQEAADNVPFSLTVAANGESDADANIVWSVQPITLRAGRTVTMNVTGMFLADPAGSNEPITVSLVNQRASY